MRLCYILALHKELNKCSLQSSHKISKPNDMKRNFPILNRPPFSKDLIEKW